MTTTTASIRINMNKAVGKLEGELEVFLYADLNLLGSTKVDLGKDGVFDQDVWHYADNVVSKLWGAFIHAPKYKTSPLRVNAGLTQDPGMWVEDSAGRQLGIIFDYKGQRYVAPPGMEIQIANTGDAVPTTYYTAPQSSAPPVLLAKPHGSVFPPPNSLTMGPNQIEALERMAGGITPFMTPTSDRSCGNCANYGLLSRRCSKSNRRDIDQNTQCFTDNFKSPENRG